MSAPCWRTAQKPQPIIIEPERSRSPIGSEAACCFLPAFTVAVGTPRGRCAETGLNWSCPSRTCTQRRGLKEEQAAHANPRHETTGIEQKMQKRTKKEPLQHTRPGSAHCDLHNPAVHHRHSPLRTTASAGQRRHGDACLET